MSDMFQVMRDDVLWKADKPKAFGRYQDGKRGPTLTLISQGGRKRRSISYMRIVDQYWDADVGAYIIETDRHMVLVSGRNLHKIIGELERYNVGLIVEKHCRSGFEGDGEAYVERIEVDTLAPARRSLEAV